MPVMPVKYMVCLSVFSCSLGLSGTSAVLAGAVDALETPPPICSGHGDLNSISFTDWEAGLGEWTVGTESVANPAAFDAEDWKATEDLPDARPGIAAFVANLESGTCEGPADDKSGLLFLQSPAIELPAGVMVPRMSFDHWFNIERPWDGGNLKLSVNGGSFSLIPTTAIEFNTYERKLNSADDGNTNPMASQPAYTGANDGELGAWEQVWINLSGLAQAGDSIRIRFDFGIDECGGAVGWYVDDVRVYTCSDELPASECGNGYLDAEEQCDDGNTYLGDGCSNTCEIEDGWACTEPLPPIEIPDGGFEAGTPSPFWTEASTNFGTPICDAASCDVGTGSGPASGTFWARFGGSVPYEESSVKQTFTIPPTASELTFALEASWCDSNLDYLEVRIDEVRQYVITGSSPLCGLVGYSTQTIAIDAFADDNEHLLEFHAEMFGLGDAVTNIFVDDLAMLPEPSICSVTIFADGFETQ
jgi:cysteine-rich repeat protein